MITSGTTVSDSATHRCTMKVAIFWGGGKFQQVWDKLLANAGVSPDDVYVIMTPGHPDEPPAPSGLLASANRVEVFDHLPPGEVVLAAPDEANWLSAEVSLVTFEHPENAIYAFGADNVSAHPDHFGSRRIHARVGIPGGEIHSHTAAAIMLYDRRVKAQ